MGIRTDSLNESGGLSMIAGLNRLVRLRKVRIFEANMWLIPCCGRCIGTQMLARELQMIGLFVLSHVVRN
jgi:hypothetical protein